MKKLAALLNKIVFAAATAAIAGVFYEGMALKWFNVVMVLIMIMDYSFFASTIINLLVYRKTKLFYFNVFSLVLIILAFVMKFSNISYPILGLVFWYFYIWFLYGIQIAKEKFGQK